MAPLVTTEATSVTSLLLASQKKGTVKISSYVKGIEDWLGF